jgi:hypothetical protein
MSTKTNEMEEEHLAVGGGLLQDPKRVFFPRGEVRWMELYKYVGKYVYLKGWHCRQIYYILHIRGSTDPMPPNFLMPVSPSHKHPCLCLHVRKELQDGPKKKKICYLQSEQRRSVDMSWTLPTWLVGGLFVSSS